MTRPSTSASGGFSNYGFIHCVYDEDDDDLNLICHEHYKWIMLLFLCKIELNKYLTLEDCVVSETWHLF
jgi:hypothetical protein